MSVLPHDEAFAIPDIIRTATNLPPPDVERVRIVDIVRLDTKAAGRTWPRRRRFRGLSWSSWRTRDAGSVDYGCGSCDDTGVHAIGLLLRTRIVTPPHTFSYGDRSIEIASRSTCCSEGERPAKISKSSDCRGWPRVIR